MKQMEGLYEAQNMDLGDIKADRPKKLNNLRMRAILDLVVEQLPPLLELGDVPANVIPQQYDFPYHRPSVISISTAESAVMTESLGFVLLQVFIEHCNLDPTLFKLNVVKVLQGSSWAREWCFSGAATCECKKFKQILLQLLVFECPHHL